MDAWTFRPTFPDSWISEAFARDTETLTKALQKSLSNPNHHHSSAADGGDAAAVVSAFLNPALEFPKAIGGGGGGSGSDPETPVAVKRGMLVPVNGGGKAATKRKSRASKRTTTTFITADPANFRQMVQQVTGVRFSGENGQIPAPVLLKPEPQRPSVINRVQQGCLPTLDTSAFLLDHHHYRQQVLPPSATSSVTSVAEPSLTAVSQPGGVDFDSFPSFPTLESWKVM
jgi:hypothetical protein